MLCFATIRFEEGLQLLGLLSEVRKNTQTFKEVFVFRPTAVASLDSTVLEHLFVVQWTCEEGSNKRLKEKRVLNYWCDFLQDLAGMNDALVVNLYARVCICRMSYNVICIYCYYIIIQMVLLGHMEVK